jgi:PKD repeat protein
MSLRELFRQKLGNAKVIPDVSVSSKLMRRLARQEFLRFNPVRFNIYYLGGIMVAAITSAIILLPGKTNSDQSKPLKPTSEITNAVSKEIKVVSDKQAIISKANTSDKKAAGSIRNQSNTRTPIASAKVPFQTSHSLENIKLAHTVVNDSVTEKSLFGEPLPEKNKLKGGMKQVDASFETSATEGCAPLNVSFFSKSTSFDSCRWTFGDGGYSNEKNPKWIFDVEGEYKVVLSVFGSEGMVATSSTIVTVYPRPVARFEIAPEKAILPKDEIHFYNYSTDASQYRWDFGDGSTSSLAEPQHWYTKFANYNVRLIVTSDYGCSDSLAVMNAFSGSEYFIELPNAFIPNTLGPTGGYYSAKSDEAAQVFHPIFSGVSDYQLKIFSKFGILIFESNDINIGWDGYFRGQLSDPGVYIWKVRGNFRNGEQFIKMGDVTLLRN